MIAVIDNYDSFTYNLVQALGSLGADVPVYRNDAVTVAALEATPLAGLVISPGPSVPSRAGISIEAVRRLGARVPVLGVCLGHQAIGEAYGGRVVGAQRIMHGKTSAIFHQGGAPFAGVGNPFSATRYHSLVLERESLPGCLEVVAWDEEGTIMGIAHRQYPVMGVQFHPESVLTAEGNTLLANFLNYCYAGSAAGSRRPGKEETA